MAQSTEEIRRELDAKRDALTRDVERLETKVRSTFDLSHQIEERPLLSVGLAMLGGFIIGRMGGGGPAEAERPPATYSQGHFTSGMGVYTGPAWSGQSHQFQPEASGPGFVDHVKAGVQESFRRGTQGGSLESVVTNISAALTALLVDKAKEMLDDNLPGFASRYERLTAETAAADTSRHFTPGSSPASGVGQASGQPYSAPTMPGDAAAPSRAPGAGVQPNGPSQGL
jgi:hypothetical protein